ncbi:major tail protein [Gordonia phage Finkle]|uniref:Major tail protein n=1 Tax=Gordonia phage Finkle TaxID=2926099 RepID=A0A9E7T0R8_9CAUD|nr:major tail protein [Gordonia phage Finkle]UTN92932.1 major tail protein [Gordonia phage Finkle]
MADILLPPPGAELDTIPAGLWACQVLKTGVKIAAATEADWLFINGLRKFGDQFDPQSEDDSDITMGPWKSEAGTSNGFKVDVEGLYKGESDVDGFVPDPGLTSIIEAGRQAPPEKRVIRMWRTDDVPDAYLGVFLCKVKLDAGAPTELQKFSGELICSGKPQSITKPIAPTGP